MIVNSYPYNPSQQQQQRCVGLNQNQNQNQNNKNHQISNSTAQQQQQQQQEASMNRLLNLSSVSQQNSLYGSSSFDHHNLNHQLANQMTSTTTSAALPISHDLANLQFDSAAAAAAAATPQMNAHNIMNDQSSSSSIVVAQSMSGQDMLLSRNKQQQRAATNQTNSDNSQATNGTSTTTANNDLSLYSPSSSTSLLYHIYDQINLPNDQPTYPTTTNDITVTTNGNKQQHLATTATTLNHQGKKNNSTILNPANLFNSHQQQQQLPLQMQMHQQQQQQQQHHHQNQLSQLAEMQKQQQCYSTYQQHPFSTLNLNHHHHNQTSQQSYLTTSQQQQQQNNLMLDTVMRHQRLQRPLSSSAASSMSGQSIPAYGRHPRQSFIAGLGQQQQQQQQNGNNIVGFNKSQNNLANVMHANNTLGHHHHHQHHLNNPHLIFGSNGSNSPVLTNGTTTSKHHHHHHQHHTVNSSKIGPTSCCWLFNGSNHISKHMNQRARNFFYEYRTIVKCSLLLIILAFALMSIIKFTLLNSDQPQQHTTTISSASNTPFINVNPSSSNIFNQAPLYPHHHNQKQDPSTGSILNGNSPTMLESGTDEPQQRQDMLKSRLLTGEFVILSQNFSQNQSQRTILAERIVKLMDQVFLSSPDVKQLYSRIEVISIRPNQVGGIIVNCNIILNESIAYAAQQFGLALYNSLGNSRELLAGQTGYLIDKNSIKLNSVPDKDLKSGLVPLPISLIHEFSSTTTNLQQKQQLPGPNPLQTHTPPGGETIDSIHDIIGAGSNSQPSASGGSLFQDQTNLEQQMANQVVWTEWSDWSSCLDKNGVCDSQRIHSRLRKCVAQNTGEKVDSSQCKKRFNEQDKELELSDCSRTCSLSSIEAAHIMSDAPIQLGPHTASPFLVDSGLFNSGIIKSSPSSLKSSSSDSSKDNIDVELSTTSVASVISQQQQQSNNEQQKPVSSSDSSDNISNNNNDISSASSSSLATPTIIPPTLTMLNMKQPTNEISCSNCTSGEICLLLMQQKVPFCAKVKDMSDSCGGWCKGQNQLCQPVGSSAFKCIHDSECLPEEWRCHDSQCIPMAGLCDGHSNCYDNSDERDCPIKKNQ